MKNIKEKACLCVLNRIFGFEPKIALALIANLGSAENVFSLDAKELDRITGPYFKYKGQICPQAVEQAEEELLRLERQGIRFCGYTEDDYPSLLRECEDAPAGLYIRSASPIKDLWKESISIVGTRDISPYGREWCTRIVDAAAGTPDRPLIVSGLALGTDIEAHRTALDRGLPTIGVMATGPDSIYPLRNRDTAERMAATPGCALLTDYPPGTAPLAIHFLRRNRIIAGLSRSTILIESKIKGGGMATCRLAFSYNRDVYALPGRIDDLRSQGCNCLIREKIAEPITSVDTLMSSLGLKTVSKRRETSFMERLTDCCGKNLPADKIIMMDNILQLIRNERGITLEEICRKTKMRYGLVSEMTGMLEIEGFICIDLLQRCSINYKNV